MKALLITILALTMTLSYADITGNEYCLLRHPNRMLPSEAPIIFDLKIPYTVGDTYEKSYLLGEKIEVQLSKAEAQALGWSKRLLTFTISGVQEIILNYTSIFKIEAEGANNTGFISFTIGRYDESGSISASSRDVESLGYFTLGGLENSFENSIIECDPYYQ